MQLGSGITKPVALSSNAKLSIGQNEIVMASVDFSEYRIVGKKYRDTCNNEVGRAFIYADSKQNIEIFAKKNGVLNGQGSLWFKNVEFLRRPYVIRLVNCKDVYIHDLVIVDSPSCAISLFNCENVVMENVQVISLWSYNNDGIDIDCCKNVTVKNCSFNTSDDCVSLKTTANIPCENITITGCTMTSEISGFKIGTESVGDFNNVIFKDNHIFGTMFNAIKIMSTDGGTVDNVYIKNVYIENSNGPAFIACGNRRKRFYGEKDDDCRVSTIKNVTFDGVTADLVVADNYGCAYMNACFAISGSPNSRIENIAVKNCSFDMPGGVTNNKTINVGELGGTYPEYYALGAFPASCLYARRVDGLTLENFNFTLKKDDVRQKIVLDDVTGAVGVDL